MKIHDSLIHGIGVRRFDESRDGLEPGRMARRVGWARQMVSGHLVAMAQLRKDGWVCSLDEVNEPS